MVWWTTTTNMFFQRDVGWIEYCAVRCRCTYALAFLGAEFLWKNDSFTSFVFRPFVPSRRRILIRCQKERTMRCQEEKRSLASTKKKNKKGVHRKTRSFVEERQTSGRELHARWFCVPKILFSPEIVKFCLPYPTDAHDRWQPFWNPWHPLFFARVVFLWVTHIVFD